MENPLFNPKDLGISKELRPGVGLHKLFCISLMTDIFFLGGKKKFWHCWISISPALKSALKGDILIRILFGDFPTIKPGQSRCRYLNTQTFLKARFEYVWPFTQ